MKILQVISFTVVALCTSICYSSNWVPYNPPATILSPPVIEVPAFPSLSYSTTQAPMAVVYPIRYDWVPQYINTLVVTERKGLFFNYKTYHYEPRITWVYQAIWR